MCDLQILERGKCSICVFIRHHHPFVCLSVLYWYIHDILNISIAGLLIMIYSTYQMRKFWSCWYCTGECWHYIICLVTMVQLVSNLSNQFDIWDGHTHGTAGIYLFLILKLSISLNFSTHFQDMKGPTVALLMAYIFNAMTHMAVEICLSAFKFFRLLVHSYPSSFFMHSDKVCSNNCKFG